MVIIASVFVFIIAVIVGVGLEIYRPELIYLF